MKKLPPPEDEEVQGKENPSVAAQDEATSRGVSARTAARRRRGGNQTKWQGKIWQLAKLSARERALAGRRARPN